LGVDREELINQHTLYPFYSSFLPEDRAMLILDSMKSEFGGDIHTRTGIMAGGIVISKYLKFCPECNDEDLSAYGEMYWHRLHQIPGVFVCVKHKVLLQDSTVLVQGYNKHEFHAACAENCTATNFYNRGF
jgi:hypothetical protein